MRVYALLHSAIIAGALARGMAVHSMRLHQHGWSHSDSQGKPGLTDNIGEAVDAGLVRLGRALGGLHRGRQAHHADLRHRRRHLGVAHHNGLQVTCVIMAAVKAEILLSICTSSGRPG